MPDHAAPPDRITADAFLAVLAAKDAQIDRLRLEAAKATLHNSSIRTLTRSHTRLAWWNWRRRRSIEFQLAQIAISIGQGA